MLPSGAGVMPNAKQWREDPQLNNIGDLYGWIHIYLAYNMEEVVRDDVAPSFRTSDITVDPEPQRFRMEDREHHMRFKARVDMVREVHLVETNVMWCEWIFLPGKGGG